MNNLHENRESCYLQLGMIQSSMKIDYKKILGIVLISASALLTTASFALSDDPTLVLDALNKPMLPQHFRSTSAPALRHLHDTSKVGLANLHIIGSGQFAESQLKRVVQSVHAPIFIIDLRQESHGFVNGDAISWYGNRDWANNKKAPIQVAFDQHMRLNQLRTSPVVTINKIISKNADGELTQLSPLKVHVKTVASETTLAQTENLGYARLYVTDHLPPTKQQVDHFIALTRTMPSKTWLYFHCRAGKGRTTTFMAMYDMMENAKKVRLQDIIKRQQELGGINLFSLPPKSDYRYAFAVQRMQFLQQFYLYCKANKDDYASTWSGWVSRHTA